MQHDRDDDDIPFTLEGLSPSPNGTTPPQPGTLPASLDLEDLRLRQDFDQLAGTSKILTTIPVRKPRKFEFVRTRPEAEWFATVVYESEEDRAYYLIAPGLLDEVAGLVKPVSLAGAVFRNGTFFFWPLRLPGADGRTMAWWTSAYEAAQQAQTAWVRLAANQSAGAYNIYLAEHQHVQPVWPDLPLADLLRLAFRNHYIDRYDHPELKRLRGAV